MQTVVALKQLLKSNPSQIRENTVKHGVFVKDFRWNRKYNSGKAVT